MKNTIATLTKIANEADSLEAASQRLAEQQPRFSKQAAKKVMLDIQDFLEEKIDEKQLSLFLYQHGFEQA